MWPSGKTDFYGKVFEELVDELLRTPAEPAFAEPAPAEPAPAEPAPAEPAPKFYRPAHSEASRPIIGLEILANAAETSSLGQQDGVPPSSTSPDMTVYAQGDTVVIS